MKKHNWQLNKKIFKNGILVGWEDIICGMAFARVGNKVESRRKDANCWACEAKLLYKSSYEGCLWDFLDTEYENSIKREGNK